MNLAREGEMRSYVIGRRVFCDVFAHEETEERINHVVGSLFVFR